MTRLGIKFLPCDPYGEPEFKEVSCILTPEEVLVSRNYEDAIQIAARHIFGAEAEIHSDAGYWYSGVMGGHVWRRINGEWQSDNDFPSLVAEFHYKGRNSLDIAEGKEILNQAKKDMERWHV